MDRNVISIRWWGNFSSNNIREVEPTEQMNVSLNLGMGAVAGGSQARGQQLGHGRGHCPGSGAGIAGVGVRLGDTGVTHGQLNICSTQTKINPVKTVLRLVYIPNLNNYSVNS